MLAAAWYLLPFHRGEEGCAGHSVLAPLGPSGVLPTQCGVSGLYSRPGHRRVWRQGTPSPRERVRVPHPQVSCLNNRGASRGREDPEWAAGGENRLQHRDQMGPCGSVPESPLVAHAWPGGRPGRPGSCPQTGHPEQHEAGDLGGAGSWGMLPGAPTGGHVTPSASFPLTPLKVFSTPPGHLKETSSMQISTQHVSWATLPGLMPLLYGAEHADLGPGSCGFWSGLSHLTGWER